MSWVSYKEKYEVCEDARIRFKGTDVLLDTYDYGGKPGKRYAGVTMTYPKYVHRVVCEAFHGAPPTEKHTVDHIDGNRLNNHKDNLCWLPMSENNKRKGVIRAPKGKPGGLRQHYIVKDKYTKKDGTLVEYFYVRIRKHDLKYMGKFKTLEEAISARDAALDAYDIRSARVITISSQTPIV
jgi:hypothetical protein